MGHESVLKQKFADVNTLIKTVEGKANEFKLAALRCEMSQDHKTRDIGAVVRHLKEIAFDCLKNSYAGKTSLIANDLKAELEKLGHDVIQQRQLACYGVLTFLDEAALLINKDKTVSVEPLGEVLCEFVGFILEPAKSLRKSYEDELRSVAKPLTFKEKKERRDKRIRELDKETRGLSHGDLAQLASSDPVIQALDTKVTADIVRKARKPRKK